MEAGSPQVISALPSHKNKEAINMKRKILRLLFAATVISAAALTGCGQSGTTTAQNQSAGKGTVALSVAFPDSTGATKSLIPADTQSIEVYALPVTDPYAGYFQPGMPTGVNGTAVATPVATLTAATPSTTITLIPGDYIFHAFAYNTPASSTVGGTNMRYPTATARSGGTIVNGANSVDLTFASGVWTIADASGAAGVTLGDGTVLKDFVIGGDGGTQPLYKKSAIDPTKPVGSMSGMLRFRFNNNTSARTYGGMESQFIGTTKSNRMHTGTYNVTRKCSSDTDPLCIERLGDRSIMVNSGPDSSSGYYDYYNGVKRGDAYELLPNKGKTTFSQDITTAFTETSFTGGKSISGSFLEIVAKTDRASTIKSVAGVVAAKSVTAAVKSASATASTLTGLVVTNQQYIIYNPSGGTNKGSWQFNPAYARTTSDGKTYYESGYLLPTTTMDPVTFQYSTSYNAGDYSYGFVPTTTDLGEYCQVLDYTTKKCTQQKPSTGDIYYPWNFYDLDGNGIINYGSFKFQFYAEDVQTYDVFKYLFTATGK
jgi:hypothetical protein